MAYGSALEKKLARKMTRAVVDFELIEDGDRVVGGLSGGKDSRALMQLLDTLRQRAPIDFTLMAVNVDSGHRDYKHATITRTCEQRGWDLRMVHTSIGEIRWQAGCESHTVFFVRTASSGGGVSDGHRGRGN